MVGFNSLEVNCLMHSSDCCSEAALVVHGTLGESYCDCHLHSRKEMSLFTNYMINRKHNLSPLRTKVISQYFDSNSFTCLPKKMSLLTYKAYLIHSIIWNHNIPVFQIH